jgi:hypothetical protein
MISNWREKDIIGQSRKDPIKLGLHREFSPISILLPAMLLA